MRSNQRGPFIALLALMIAIALTIGMATAYMTDTAAQSITFTTAPLQSNPSAHSAFPAAWLEKEEHHGPS